MNRDELLTKLAMELGEWPEFRERDRYRNRPKFDTGDHNWIWSASFSDAWRVSLMGGNSTINRNDWLQRRTELINKPSWADAPEWAQWLAQDADGEWCFYPVKPAPDGVRSGGQWIHDGAHISTAKDAGTGTIPAAHNWRDTLEQRPARIKTCRHCDTSFQRPSVAGIPDDRCERCHDEIMAMRWDERRADAIGQNGPTGDHYAEDSDIESPLSRAMRELNPATSSLTYSQAEDAARETVICSDGSPCGSPHNPDDDQYCLGCPNEPVSGEDEEMDATWDDLISVGAGRQGNVKIGDLAKALRDYAMEQNNELGETAHDCPRCGGEWWSPPHSYCPCEDAAPVTADDILEAARQHMQDRAATYDKPEGERSMSSTVLAFAAITGIGMTEEQGWLFMQLLKAVRSQQGAYRADSYEDGAAYVALAGEAAAKERL